MKNIIKKCLGRRLDSLKGRLYFNIKSKDIVQFEENNKSRKIEVKCNLKYIRIPNLMLYFYTC